MGHLENTGLLILSGFFFLFFQKPDEAFICAFLLCVGNLLRRLFLSIKKTSSFSVRSFYDSSACSP